MRNKNYLDYNQVVEALGTEQEYLLRREMYGAEHILVKHALNMLAELPVIRLPEIVRCKDCKYANNPQDCMISRIEELTGIEKGLLYQPDWFCADGKRKDVNG